ncbi:MAG: chloride channel protein [Opitutales bacterium]|nr:chloride channel protein [Opitutales bacterium]
MPKEKYRKAFFSGKNLPDWLRAHLSDSQRYFVFWVLAGLLCGLAAVMFRLSIEGILKTIKSFAAEFGVLESSLIMILFPALGGLVAGLIIFKIEPTAAGSGIPQTKARYYQDFGVFKLREALWRFIVGAISVGSGMSLGPEGPTVHLCSAISSWIGQKFGLAKKRIQSMVPVGAGAGIAAAFNAPMAAMFFVFEELLSDFSTKSLFGILVAVVISSIVERTILGESPVLNATLPSFSTDWWMILCLPLAIVSALFGHLFVRLLLKSRAKFREYNMIPVWAKPGIGGLAVGILGVTVLLSTNQDGVFGIGYATLNDTINGKNLVLFALILLFFGKFFATILAFASGGSGGLFAPALFLGGILGAIVGVIGQMFFGYDSTVVGALSLLGMGSFFAAVNRCPMTSFMIIFEMTQNYSIMLPLMLGNMISYLLASKWQTIALYDSLLLQDNISLKKMPSYMGEQDWRNLPIQTIMTFDCIKALCGDTAKQSLEKLKEFKHHAYPVVNDDKKLLGMITHHELEEYARENSPKTIKEIIRRQKLITVHPEQSIRDVAKILVVEDVMQAPVVNPTRPDRLLGIVTLHDVARQQNAIEDAMER